MPLWTANDAANGAPISVGSQFNVTPNTANRNALYGNTTANAFIDGVTVGVYGIDANETKTISAAHSGWHVRTEGQGGRAGRVFFECLVAGGIVGDGSDDAIIPDATIKITSQPSSVTINDGENASFTVGASITSGSINYQWQANSGSGFSNLSSAGIYSDVDTSTLTITAANTDVTGTEYRCFMTATGAVNVTSSVVVLTVNA